jgi:hypothetical protein
MMTVKINPESQEVPSYPQWQRRGILRPQPITSETYLNGVTVTPCLNPIAEYLIRTINYETYDLIPLSVRAACISPVYMAQHYARTAQHVFTIDSEHTAFNDDEKQERISWLDVFDLIQLNLPVVVDQEKDKYVFPHTVWYWCSDNEFRVDVPDYYVGKVYEPHKIVRLKKDTELNDLWQRYKDYPPIPDKDKEIFLTNRTENTLILLFLYYFLETIPQELLQHSLNIYTGLVKNYTKKPASIHRKLVGLLDGLFRNNDRFTAINGTEYMHSINAAYQVNFARSEEYLLANGVGSPDEQFHTAIHRLSQVVTSITKKINRLICATKNKKLDEIKTRVTERRVRLKTPKKQAKL